MYWLVAYRYTYHPRNRMLSAPQVLGTCSIHPNQSFSVTNTPAFATNRYQIGSEAVRVTIISRNHQQPGCWMDRRGVSLVEPRILRHFAELFDGSVAAAIDSTDSNRHHASHHYLKHLDYGITALKTTAVVDTETQAVLDAHCTTKRRHDTQIGLQVARVPAGDLQSLTGDKGYDWQRIRDRLRSADVRPLIKHREFPPLDLAHNARPDDERYGQRWMCETVFSVIKRSLGFVVRARAWYRQFRETVLTFAVYNVKRSLTQ